MSKKIQFNTKALAEHLDPALEDYEHRLVKLPDSVVLVPVEVRVIPEAVEIGLKAAKSRTLKSMSKSQVDFEGWYDLMHRKFRTKDGAPMLVEDMLPPDATCEQKGTFKITVEFVPDAED